jgi:hypothetical protein
MGRISRNVEDIRQGHLSISKVRREVFFRQEGLPFMSRNNLSLNQLLDRDNRLFPIGPFGFEKPIQPLPQIAEDLGFSLCLAFGNRSKTVETFFKIHRYHQQGSRGQGFKWPSEMLKTSGHWVFESLSLKDAKTQ